MVREDSSVQRSEGEESSDGFKGSRFLLVFVFMHLTLAKSDAQETRMKSKAVMCKGEV